MADPNNVDLPPHRPSMAVTYRQTVNAFRVHWKAHNNAYPQKLVLTQQQAEDLHLSRQYGLVAFPEAKPRPQGVFFNTPIEISETTPGEMVAADGKVMLLADYDQMLAQ